MQVMFDLVTCQVLFGYRSGLVRRFSSSFILKFRSGLVAGRFGSALLQLLTLKARFDLVAGQVRFGVSPSL